MAEPYKDERKRQAKVSTATGIALTLTVHVAVIVFGSMSGLKYLYPPPQEQAMLIDFSEAEPFIPEQETTTVPSVPERTDSTSMAFMSGQSKHSHTMSHPRKIPQALSASTVPSKTSASNQ